MLSNVTELLTFLNSLGVRPKKSLSQNFLIDGNIVKKILHEARVHPGDTILEIGAGPGVLTEALLLQGCQVYAVEKDPIFANALQRLSGAKIFSQDIREFAFSSLPPNTKVVANLPYHLTASILSLLVPQYKRFSRLTLMVQEEVGRRITASPKTKDYGSLTVFLNFYSTSSYAFKVSRHCFYPRPKVDSAIVSLDLKKPPDIEPEEFFSFMRAAFQQRRKMIKTTLGHSIGPLLEALGENPRSRPEEISCENFLKLFLSLHRTLE